MRLRVTLALPALAAALLPGAAGSQAWSYPSFQQPRLVTRELNFALAGADGPGTSILFQWREEAGPRSQLSLDLGLANPNGRGQAFVKFIGGQVAWQQQRGIGLPLDVVFTAGANLAVGNTTLFRLPVGISVGHRFGLDQGVALTPYVHPRVSLDVCTNCGGHNDIATSVDIGANLDLNANMSLRAAALFAGRDTWDANGWGISLAITPPGLARLRR